MTFEQSALLLALAPALTSSFNLHFTKPSPRIVASFLPKSTSPPPPALGPLFGILDEVNDDSLFSLGGGKPETTSSGAPVVSDKSQAFEIFLAELVFSTQDIRVDIMDNIEKAEDPEFRQWLKEKSETSTDVDEREAMRSLSDTIEETVNMIALGKQQVRRSQYYGKASCLQWLQAFAQLLYVYIHVGVLGRFTPRFAPRSALPFYLT